MAHCVTFVSHSYSHNRKCWLVRTKCMSDNCMEYDSGVGLRIFIFAKRAVGANCKISEGSAGNLYNTIFTVVSYLLP